MKKSFLSFTFILFFVFLYINLVSESKLVNENENILSKRFNLPEGFERKKYKEDSFQYYLQNFHLKPYGTKVHYYDGRIKPKNIYEAVLDIDIGKKDLQQCADAIIRLRAEYLFKEKKYEKINFHFTNGFYFEYEKWMLGFRVSFKNNKFGEWEKKEYASDTYENFKKYMETVFIYAGTISLEKELYLKDIKDLDVGDVFIQAGSPGHSVLVMDMAENKATNDKIFILAQSYMPAQDIHILKNPLNTDYSPWYSIKFNKYLVSPEWIFNKNNLKSFE